MKKVHFNQGRKNGPIMHRRRFETCEDDETQIKAIRSMLKAWEIINESYWESLRVNNLGGRFEFEVTSSNGESNSTSSVYSILGLKVLKKKS